MVKFFAYMLVGLLVFVMFFEPARDYVNNLFHHDKQKLREEQIIGKVSGYNTRVEEIQKILKESGFEPGPIDGIMGAQTRVAIREFQKKKGLKPTGKIHSITQLALNREKEIKKSKFQPELKSDTWESFLPGKGVRNRVRQMQAALKNAGFYKGEIDGKIGPRTKTAIKAFQKAKNLNPDGVVGSKTWKELKGYLKN